MLGPRVTITRLKGASGATILTACGIPPVCITHRLKSGTSLRIPRPFKSSYKKRPPQSKFHIGFKKIMDFFFNGFKKSSLSGSGWESHTLFIRSISPLPMQINALSIELETGGP